MNLSPETVNAIVGYLGTVPTSQGMPLLIQIERDLKSQLPTESILNPDDKPDEQDPNSTVEQ